MRACVMKRFEKADKGSQTGTGLGLAIVKRITDLHDGTIELAEATTGKGLQVVVLLNARSMGFEALINLN